MYPGVRPRAVIIVMSVRIMREGIWNTKIDSNATEAAAAAGTLLLEPAAAEFWESRPHS